MNSFVRYFFLTFIIVFLVEVPSLYGKDINRLWDVHNLNYAKNHVHKYENVIKQCVEKGKQSSRLEPFSIVIKKTTFAPDLHYYCSVSPYYWPVNKDEGKVAYEYRDGLVNPEASNYNRWSFTELSIRLHRMALAFYFSGDIQIYKSFVRQLDVWFFDHDTRMYPNFDYAQVIPGVNNNQGSSSGIIEASPLTSIIESICLVDSCKSIGFIRRYRLKKWFSSFLDWMQSSDLCKNMANSKNNIGTSVNVTLLRIALFTDNKDVAGQLVDSFVKRVENQIDQEGKQPLELKRTKAYHYSTLNLRFIIEFCVIAQSAGYEIYDRSKDKINKAALFLYQFVGQESKFPYKQLNDFAPEEKILFVLLKCIDKLNGNNRTPEKINSINDLTLCHLY